MTSPKPGVRSTEFWVAVVLITAATVLLVFDKIDSQTWALAAGIGSGSYSLARGLAKR